MLPGPDQIIACPHCQGLARYATWLSGTSFGVVQWTDGKHEYLGLVGPEPPSLTKCRHCAKCYWLVEALEIGTAGWGGDAAPEEDAAWRTAPEVEEPREEEYYAALKQGVARTPQEEKKIRVLAWWRSNNARRSGVRPATTDLSQWRQNLEALATLLDQDNEHEQLMRAELLRELGEFDSAKEILNRIQSTALQSAVHQMRDLCDRGERLVKQLTFPESKNVGTLIAMLQNNASGSRVAAIRALADIGPDAQEAVPHLIELLRASDVDTAFCIRDALHAIGNWAPTALPVLIQLLNDERAMIRGLAAKLLGELGVSASPALPALRQALADESCYVRMYAERAFRAIDPTTPQT